MTICDPTDALLQGAATWEPPDGFVLRVIAASRADVRRTTERPLPRPGLDALARLRAYASGIVMRGWSTMWVLRQYWSLLRRP